MDLGIGTLYLMKDRAVTKEELVHTTLKQLSESIKTSPQNFRLEDPELNPNGPHIDPTIIWQFKVEQKPGIFVADPLNATRTIIVYYSRISKQINCYIYFREVNSTATNIIPDGKATVRFSEFLPLSWNRTYRQFDNLRTELLNKKKEAEYMEYLRKLNNIFPTIGDEELFK